jgi:hypothetical protein
MKDNPKLPPAITLEEMKDALKRSGYLIEQRVEKTFSEYGYYVQTNPAFCDLITGKSREYDINAMAAHFIDNDYQNILFPIIVCECINNDRPIVFFLKNSDDGDDVLYLNYNNIKVSGLPIRFLQRREYVNFAKFTLMEKYHHYCHGNFATQYCSFNLKQKGNKDKSKWIALHPESFHSDLDSLIQVVENLTNEHYVSWNVSEKPEEETVNIQIYYPLIILQGDLFGAKINLDSMELIELDHVQLIKSTYLYGINKQRTYQIDIISENYLSNYLDKIDEEFKRMLRYFRNKKHIVRISIDKIVEEYNSLNDKKISIRDIFGKEEL